MNRKEIGSRLRKLRGQRKREEVAMACGITASAVAMYETGARVPSDAVKIKLARFFDTSVEALFFAEEVNRR